MLRTTYWIPTTMAVLLAALVGCGVEGPVDDIGPVGPQEEAAAAAPERSQGQAAEEGAPTPAGAEELAGPVRLSDPLSFGAATERLSLRTHGVLGLRDLLGDLPASGRPTTSSPRSSTPGLSTRRQGLQQEGADEDEELPEGVTCWEELLSDGTETFGCWDEVEGAFEVTYVFAEPQEGVSTVHQIGELFYLDFVAGQTSYTETLTMDDGQDFVTDYECGFEPGLSECWLQTGEGQQGTLRIMEDHDFFYYEETWTDDLSYALGYGVTYLLDGGMQVWYAEDDLLNATELDYLSQMFYDADGVGWGMIEVPDELGDEMLRFTVQVWADGSGLYTDAEGNSFGFDAEGEVEEL